MFNAGFASNLRAKFSDTQPRDDHGRWTDNLGGQYAAEREDIADADASQAALETHLVDYKADRELTGPDSRAIADVLPGAKTVGYLAVPGIRLMHERMGIEPTLRTDPAAYVAARDELFDGLPQEQVAVGRLIYTQPRINLPRVEGMLATLARQPDRFDREGVQVIRQHSHDYVMNGHHRVVAMALDGKATIPAHVLDLRGVKYRRPRLKYSDAQPRDEHGRWTSGTGALDDTEQGDTHDPHAASRQRGNGRVLQTTLEPDARERVLAQLHAAGIDSALDAASPEFRQTYETIMAKAPAASQELGTKLQQVVAAMGGSYLADVMNGTGLRAHLGPIKSGQRIIEKAVIEEQGDLGVIRDVVRGIVAVDSVKDVDATASAIRSSFDIVREKNRFADPLDTGYRDMLFNVRMSNGLVGELQLHVKPLLQAKEHGGHQLYERLRTLVATTAAAAQERVHLLEQSRLLYATAWLTAGGLVAHHKDSATTPRWSYWEVEDRTYRAPYGQWPSMEIWSRPDAAWLPYQGDWAKVVLVDGQALDHPPAHVSKRMKFSDDQARDDHGRWTESGGSETPRTFDSDSGYAWHETGPGAAWAKTLSKDELRVLGNYAGFGYKDINNTLRGNPPMKVEARDATPAERAQLEALGLSYRSGTVITLPDGGRLRWDMFHRDANGTHQPWVVEHDVVNEARKADALKMADTMNTMIRDHGIVLAAPMTVNRYAYFPGVTADDLRASIGTTRVEQGFTSTMVGDAAGRLAMGPAAQMAESKYDRFGKVDHPEVGTAVTFSIHLPAGTHVASIEAARRVDHDNLTNKAYRVESELLLGSGAHFQVRSVEPGPVSRYVDIHAPTQHVTLQYMGGGSSQP